MLFLSTACGSSSAKVRVMNTFANVSSIDMLINNQTIASGIAYGAASAYSSASSGSHNLVINVSGGSSALINQTVDLGSGSTSTILATNSGAVVLGDDNSSPSSGNVKIRVINGSPTLGAADVYVVPSGTDIATVNPPTFSSLAYQSASTYDAVAAGSNQVIFTLPGQKFQEITSSSFSFSGGQIRSVVALDTQGGGFTTAVLSDLN